MSTPATHFVGRRPQLSLLDAALDELDGRRAKALEIVGAAGIGKTRLLAELAARADGRGHIVLSGAGADLERDLPFWVFVDALDEYLAGVEPRRLANLEEDVRVELAQVFPSLSDLRRGGSPGALHERYRINRAVRELLERLAATKPLVLILDDFLGRRRGGRSRGQPAPPSRCRGGADRAGVPAQPPIAATAQGHRTR